MYLLHVIPGRHENMTDGWKNLTVDLSFSEENTEDKYAIPSKMPPKHALEATSPLEDIVKAMQNPE